jgi:hypothetical protein
MVAKMATDEGWRANERSTISVGKRELVMAEIVGYVEILLLNISNY